jgi:hypothetical protein
MVTSAAISVGPKGIGGRGRTALPSVTKFSSSFRGSALMRGAQRDVSSRQITVGAALLAPPFSDNHERLAPPLISGERLHHRAGRVAVCSPAIAQALDATQAISDPQCTDPHHR